ncbi:MAG: class I adenylate-forming enzyme family protein [Pseudomonadota bacterium]
MDIAKQLDGVFRLEPEAEALEFEKRWITWGELTRVIDSINGILDAAGIGEDEGVAMLLRNRPPHYAAIVAMLISRRCIVTVNPMQPREKYLAELESLRTRAIIADREDWAHPGVAELADRLGSVAISLDAIGHDCVQTLPGRDRLGDGPFHEPFTGVAIQMLTSGTTGTPKRIPLRRRTLEKALEDAMVYEKDRSPDDPPKLRSGVTIQQMPFVHISGIFGVAGNALAGRKGVLLERFSVEGWHDAVKRHRPKVASAVPTALRMILDADIPKEDLSSLIALRSGTAPLPPELADEVMARYGIPVLGNYGATEFAGGVAGWSYKDFKAHWETKRGSVGRVHDGIDARVVHPESFEELPTGEAGLLELRGGQIEDGKTWVRTNDLARLDEDRFLYILGRADNAIIRGGFKIIPGDVADVLESHPAVKEAAVVGLDDRRLGQVPVAAFELAPGAEAPTDDELAEWIRSRMTAYSVPVAFKAVDELPRTPSLKVSAVGVKELFGDLEQAGA